MRNITLLALLLALTLFSSSAWALRAPVYFTVESDGQGFLSPINNEVMAFSPDGAEIFHSSQYTPTGWPDRNNRLVQFSFWMGLSHEDELDAMSWGFDPIEPVDQGSGDQPLNRDVFFSVDRKAVGTPGSWPPDVFTEAGMGQAPGDIYFTLRNDNGFAIGNHLGVPEIMLGLGTGTQTETPDELDGFDFGKQHDEPRPQEGPFLYFSLNRVSCGLPGNAAWTECASSGPPEQAADIFITNFSGSHGLFADEKSMGLDGNDDNIDAFALYDWGPEGQPNGILDRGMDQIWFSVDGVGTWGLPGTAVNTECTAGNCAGDIFWSDFTGYNLKVLDGFQLGLVEPIPAIPLQEDEDDLDGLDVALILDTDNDHIPDLVDNCPYTFNPMQGDADLNGVGDVCDTTSTTGVDELMGGADMEHGLHEASPNPFARSTELSFALAAEGHATLDIYNVSGRHMTRLVDENLAAGGHTVNWNGMDESGSAAPAGVYFARFVTDGTTETRKLILIK